MNDTYINEAEKILRWRNLHHLKPIWSDVFNIAKRVYEYSNNLFVVFNTKTQKYEIHSIANGPGANSKEMDIPYDELDTRTLDRIWWQDIRVHGEEIFKRLDRQAEEYKKRKEKEFRDEVNALARDTRTIFKRASYGTDDKLHHYMGGVKGETKRNSKSS